MYSVRGRNAQTAATLNHAVFGFWNPHSTQIIRLMAITMSVQLPGGAGGASHWIGGTFRRTTARGTAGSTVTPDVSNDSKYAAGPVSGALLDLAAFTGQPTLEADNWGPNIAAADGAGGQGSAGNITSHRFPGSGIYIPPGAGIALIQTEAVASPIFEITLSWLED